MLQGTNEKGSIKGLQMFSKKSNRFDHIKTKNDQIGAILKNDALTKKQFNLIYIEKLAECLLVKRGGALKMKGTFVYDLRSKYSPY